MAAGAGQGGCSGFVPGIHRGGLPGPAPPGFAGGEAALPGAGREMAGRFLLLAPGLLASWGFAGREGRFVGRRRRRA